VLVFVKMNSSESRCVLGDTEEIVSRAMMLEESDTNFFLSGVDEADDASFLLLYWIASLSLETELTGLLQAGGESPHQDPVINEYQPLSATRSRHSFRHRHHPVTPARQAARRPSASE